MIELTPLVMADLWYLRFGANWVLNDDLEHEWQNIKNDLMKNNFLLYQLVAHKKGYVECYQLKVAYANN
jgi:hypothetical protein